jgi:ectoine hydroxylase-related dioxygenase (phytanoyl-CoA dioxygenase family)
MDTSPLETARALPAATTDLDAALADLDTHGLCLMERVLDPGTLARARDALYAAAADDRLTGRRVSGFALDRDDRNVRVWNLLNRDPVFCELAEHPTAIALVRHVLGWPALLSNISGNITAPGSVAGVLHPDQIFVPEPWPERPQGINITWCIDAFTADNGATQVVPGSHRWNRSPAAADTVDPITVEAAAGSVFAFDSRIWHRTGANSTRDGRRAAIFPFYSRPVYRTQENWFLSLDAGVVTAASDTLLTLLAYRSEGFGLVYGESPHRRLPGLCPGADQASRDR